MTPEQIKKLRGSLGLNQFEFAEAVGVGRGTVTSWEKGYKYPQPKNIEKMLTLSNVPKNWVELTTEEIDQIGEIFQEKNRSIQAWGLFALAIEHKIKSKNI
jgi:transcriptional regulator with XRE-family HTH domain